MIDIDVDVKGFDEAAKTIQKTFPRTARQRSVLQGAMRDAGRPTVLVDAAIRASALGGSGSLAQALTFRNRSIKSVRAAGAFGGVELVVKRHMQRAIKAYEAFYGRKVTDGIRHGHLVEFGTRRTAAKPFLWPAAVSNTRRYVDRLSKEIWRSIRKNILKERRKLGKRR